MLNISVILFLLTHLFAVGYLLHINNEKHSPSFDNRYNKHNNNFDVGVSQIFNQTLEDIPHDIRQKLTNSQGITTQQQGLTMMNLWDLTIQQKQNLFKVFYFNYTPIQTYNQYKLYEQKNNLLQQNNSSINGEQQQSQFYLKRFKLTAEEIDWKDYNQLTKHQSKLYQQKLQQILIKRQQHINQYLLKYSIYKNNLQHVNTFSNITKGEFYNEIQNHKIMMNNYVKTNSNESDKKNYHEFIKRQKQEMNLKYHLNSVTEQLKACIIVNSYNTVDNQNKYIWNIQSILQQQYQNYKVIIIDDASPDNTSNKIGKHLKYKNADPSKFIIIKNLKRNKDLYNLYYAAHKYCNLGEILYVIDGGDQLIGTQVFKLINAIYQKQKPYTLYTQRIIQKTQNETKYIKPGNNHKYTQFVQDHNAYRWDHSHGYNNLQTMLSDLFLLTDISSLKYKDGEFIDVLTDNAVYLSALELSCGRVRFLQQFVYWQDQPILNQKKIDGQINNEEYCKQVGDYIQGIKPYKCVHEYLLQTEKWSKNKEQ